MILLYIIYFTLFFIMIGSIIYRIIADVIEYIRIRPKEKAQPFVTSQITINRRESSVLTSIAVWDFLLNGENIGRAKDGGSITVTTGKRINELKAKNSNGAESAPLKFLAESGCSAEVRFNNGRFQNPQGMSILPLDDKDMRRWGVKPGRSISIIWAVLIGYYAAVFLLSRVHIVYAYAMPFLSILALGIASRRPYLDLIDYISYNYPDEWVGISGNMAHSLWIPNLIFHDTVIGDIEYLRLKIRYEGVLGALIFSLFAYIAAIAYVYITVNR